MNDRQKRLCLAFLMLGTVLLTAIGATPAPQTSTPAQTPSFPSGEPLPLQAAGWESVVVNTVCLQIEQKYPGIDVPIVEPIGQGAEYMLSGVGVQTVTDGLNVMRNCKSNWSSMARAEPTTGASEATGVVPEQ